MVFEVLFFFVSLTVLGLWLFAREALIDWRRRYRAYRVHSLLAEWQDAPVMVAERRLGPPHEIVVGSSGRSLHVWKNPPGIPQASTLLIVTLTVDPGGRITHSALEER